MILEFWLQEVSRQGLNITKHSVLHFSEALESIRYKFKEFFHYSKVNDFKFLKNRYSRKLSSTRKSTHIIFHTSNSSFKTKILKFYNKKKRLKQHNIRKVFFYDLIERWQSEINFPLHQKKHQREITKHTKEKL